MINLKKYALLPLIAVGFISPAMAQQGNRGGGNRNNGGGNRSTTTAPRQNNSSFRQNNSSFSRPNRQPAINQPRQNTMSMNRGGNNISSNRNPGNRNYSTPRNNRGGYQSNPGRINNSRIVTGYRGNNISGREYSNNRYRYNSGINRYSYTSRYSYFPRRYSYSGYQRYSILPRTFISISFGGYPYYYNSGSFYSYYNGYYEPVYAPFGIRVSSLPYGYYPFYSGTNRYYYYDGTYYRDYENSQYEVVDAPMGAVVGSLPKGATVAMVNGEKFYEFNGTYYKETTNPDNKITYTVVGKYGEINNSDNEDDVEYDHPLENGDIVTVLPKDSRTVTIDGKTLYISPDNIYFKEKLVDGVVNYEVVGMEEPQQDQ